MNLAASSQGITRSICSLHFDFATAAGASSGLARWCWLLARRGEVRPGLVRLSAGGRAPGPRPGRRVRRPAAGGFPARGSSSPPDSARSGPGCGPPCSRGCLWWSPILARASSDALMPAFVMAALQRCRRKAGSRLADVYTVCGVRLVRGRASRFLPVHRLLCRAILFIHRRVCKWFFGSWGFLVGSEPCQSPHGRVRRHGIY